MQFHLNGFRPGDPDILPEATAPHSDELPDQVDVLIVGCGPTGLTLAAPCGGTRFSRRTEEEEECRESIR